MKTSFLGFAMVLTAMTGCNATVSNGNCEEPEPGGSGGCGATWECIDGEWVDTSEQAEDNCLPPSDCPATLPEFGSPCNGSTQCEYPGTDEECGDPNQPFYADCVDGAWQISTTRCSPPPECPELIPTAGTDCTGWDFAFACSYEIDCGAGPTPLLMSCGFESGAALWQVDSGMGCTDCVGLDATTCGASSECQWLTPGCEIGAPPIAEGCYPKLDCQSDGCNGDLQCALYSYNPCVDAACGSCGTTFGVCEEPPPPPPQP